MNIQIEKFKITLESEDVDMSFPINNEELVFFQKKNNVLLPKDLIEYFENINGTNDEYNIRSFRFYSLHQFKSIDEELKYFCGSPDYSGIVNSLREYDSYFVFADYFSTLFAYAIQLSSNNKVENEVLIIGGDQYKKIANSFSEFIELYLNDSIELYFND